jgi:hypothetical protein
LLKRTEADFQAWRDARDWTVKKYALWDAGKRLTPNEWEPGKPCSIYLKYSCGDIFNSRRPISLRSAHIAPREATGWKRPFGDPIPMPRGRPPVTLEDAGNYITKLPKAEHEAAEWQAAMEALILVATLGGPTMFARIGVMRAINRHVEPVFNRDRVLACFDP